MARPKNSNTEKLTGRIQKPTANPFTIEPLTEVPLPPEWMTVFELEYYNRVCGVLVQARQLRDIDIENVIIAATWWDVYRTSRDHMQANGLFQTSTKTGWEQASPATTAMKDAAVKIQGFADRYGLNLTSKSKVPAARSDKNSLGDMFVKK